MMDHSDINIVLNNSSQFASQDVDQSATPNKSACFRYSTVAVQNSSQFLRLKDILVTSIKHSPVEFEARQVAVTPNSWEELRQHPMFSVHYLTTILKKVAEKHQTLDDFEALLFSEVGKDEQTTLSTKDKQAIIQYLKDIVIAEYRNVAQNQDKDHINAIEKLLDRVSNDLVYLHTRQLQQNLKPQDQNIFIRFFNFIATAIVQKLAILYQKCCMIGIYLTSQKRDFAELENVTENFPDWINTFYDYFSRKVDEKNQALVKTKAEVAVLFADLQQQYTQPEQLITELRYFRKLQQHGHTASIHFLNVMFSSLVLEGDLKEDPTCIQLTMDANVISVLGGREAVIKTSLNQKMRALQASLLKRNNFAPDVCGDSRMRDKGLVPAGSGLFNYNNNCFMNSTLQAAARGWQKSGVIDSIRRGTSPYALFNLFDSLYHSASTGANRKEKIWQLVKLVQRDPCVIHQLNVPNLVPAFEAYQSLRYYFIVLCDRLNQRSGQGTTLIQEQKDFFAAYAQYGAMLNKQNIKALLHTASDGKVVFARIPQQDPQEFFTTITEALGIDNDPVYGIINRDKLTLAQDNRILDSKLSDSYEIVSQIAIPLAGESLQSMIDHYTAKEILQHDNQLRWDPERLRALNVRQNKDTVTTKQIVMMAKQPPKQLAMQVKLFSNYDANGQFIAEARYLKEEGKALLKTLEPAACTVNIPMVLEHGNRQQVIDVPYKVSSMVCHRGSSLQFGHYITIKFQDDQIIICDDDVVADIHSYARFHGRESYKSWQDFCDREKISPYLLFSTRID